MKKGVINVLDLGELSKQETKRVLEVGGTNVIRADVYGTHIYNYVMLDTKSFASAMQIVEFAVKDLPLNNKAICYLIAGVVLPNGLIEKSPQVPMLNGRNFIEMTKAIYDGRIFIGNDMDGGAMGVSLLLPNLRYFINVVLGTGTNGRIVHEGKIICKGEYGHIIYKRDLSARLCHCGLTGCYESEIGGWALEKKIIESARILRIEIPEGLNPCCFLDMCFDRGDKWAVIMYQEIAYDIAHYFANLQSIAHAPVFVLKGTFSVRGFPLIEKDVRSFMKDGMIIRKEWVDEIKFIISPEPKLDSIIGVAELEERAFNELY